jgi:1,4-dihydroxy-2-naphthoate octaprenyltransferase
MTVFPLSGLYLSMLLANQLASYIEDEKRQRQTMMRRMGWQNGIAAHNLAIIAAFLMWGLAAIYGFPMGILIPVFLLIPIGGMQIWQMQRIIAGAKPQWRSLTSSAAALFGAAVYLLFIGFWLR